MITFIQYIRNYFKQAFNWRTHAVVLGFLIICICINYGIKVNDRNSLYELLTHYNPRPLTTFGMLFVFFCTPFFFTIAVVSISEGKKVIFNRSFIGFSLFAILLLSFDYSYYLMNYIDQGFDYNPFVHAWVYDCASNLSSFLTIVLPLYLLYFSTKTFRPELYGFRLNGANLRPYLWMTVLMIPLIFAASFLNEFAAQYPMYTEHFAYEHLSLSQWQTEAIFELCYGSRFISVELLFRGFMVVGLSKFVGREAILPMVAVYCFLHFGKPAGEAVSSIFGGYILGIFAYASRNIFGGLVAHLGIAWGMELMIKYNPFI